MSENRDKRDVTIGLCMLIISIVLVGMSLRIKDAQYMRLSGSRLVPLTVSAAMLVFSVIRCIVSLKTRGTDAKQEQEIKHNYYPWIIAITLLIAFAFVLESIGFIISSMILLAAFSPLFGLTNPLKVLILSLSVSLGSWLIFVKLFGSHLPVFTLF